MVLAESLTFDPKTHTYYWAGEAVPSVTQILAARGMYTGSEHWTDQSRDIGRAVHDAIHLSHEDDLDIMSLDERIVGHYQAFLKFRYETGMKPRLWEVRLYHRIFGYAGTFDLTADCGGVYTLIDFKTGGGEQQVAYKLQLAAYDLLIGNNREQVGEYPIRAVTVELRADGKYNMRVVENITYWHARWLECCNLTNLFRRS